MSQNPFTLRSFADWIKDNREQDRVYDWSCSYVCACGQYARALGVKDWCSLAERGSFWNMANHLACEYPRTWGALEMRLRAEEDAQ